MNIFANELYDFHKVESYSSLDLLLSATKEFFFSKFRGIDEKEFYSLRLPGVSVKEKKQAIESWLIQKIDLINRIVQEEANGKLDAANKLYGLLFQNNGMPKYPKLFEDIDAGEYFYRVRDALRYTLYDKKDIFIIPADKENCVGAARFNFAGNPCLYLASNLYLAWEECRRPDFDTFNFAVYQNVQRLKVISLTIRPRFLYREHFLAAYLALLCSVKISEGDRFHYQYVVPQLVMKVLRESQQKSAIAKQNIIAGIKYMSSRRFDQKDFLFDDRRLSVAYAFPGQTLDNGQSVCPYLQKIFKLSDPRTFFLYRVRKLNFHTNTAFVSDYQESIFYQLEEEIKKTKLERL